ncbi:putative heterokaryon incompatibility protein [Triangularia verruculosa]|uniref:Heterokaryon incompatibility protein n=1 Tax=Triangularia verruculosa TaxID=2587418 RepID=A0AAN6XI41_9PEZI|nr:putative heterokaryon incompatibility protein [Triangularia verruculosa]
MVTRNLDTALRHLRLPDLTMPIWVDAICIDQQNTTERSQQVAVMCEIYRRAGETFVWIGPAEDNSDMAMDWVDLVGHGVEVDWNTEAMGTPEYITIPEYQHVADASMPWEFTWPGAPLQLCYLANREYFTRLWVRQEVKLSPRKVLICGKKRVEWELFSGFARWMAIKPYTCVDEHGYWTKELAAMYKDGSNLVLNICARTFDGAFPTLDRLRFDNSKLKWTDPRDAIYANLGLLAPEYRQLGIEPNYDQDPAEVFIDVAVRVATKLCSLGFLESCDLILTDIKTLPSWVPDWSSSLIVEAGMQNIWSSCAWISAQVEYLGDGVLAANGVLVTEVIEVDYWEDEKLYFDQLYMVYNCIRYWCDLKPADYDERQEQYMDGSNLTWLEAWCTLFLYGNIKDIFEAGQESRINRPDLWSMQEAKELFLIILTAPSFHDIWSLDDELWRRLEKFLSKIGDRMKGRTVFQTAGGHIGVAPAVWAGDSVAVLLGCPVPVLLWPKTDHSRWRVSSTCYIVGLMSGEAILGPLHSWRAVDWRYREGMSPNDKINRLHSGLFNEDGTLKTDPSKVLEDCGIPCIRYEREPHVLEVSPDALRDAGINLQKFELV